MQCPSADILTWAGACGPRTPTGKNMRKVHIETVEYHEYHDFLRNGHRIGIMLGLRSFAFLKLHKAFYVDSICHVPIPESCAALTGQPGNRKNPFLPDLKVMGAGRTNAL